MNLFGGFVNPALLAGLAAAGVPIAIHLLNRRRQRYLSPAIASSSRIRPAKIAAITTAKEAARTSTAMATRERRIFVKMPG